MPTPTYDLIEEKVLGSAAANVDFTSIPGTYKDLVLEIVAQNSAFNSSRMRFNSDTGTNYSSTYLIGDGSTATSARGTNNTFAALMNTGSGKDTQLYTTFVNLLSYANSSVNKTILTRTSASNSEATAIVSLWRNTAAITSINLYVDGANFNSGSRFRLWGVSG